MTTADDIRCEGNLIIWQVNRDYRYVWEIDPIGGAVVSFSKEHYKVRRGRGHWVSRSEEIWSNPDFAGPHPQGTMAECPEVPAETRG